MSPVARKHGRAWTWIEELLWKDVNNPEDKAVLLPSGCTEVPAAITGLRDTGMEWPRKAASTVQELVVFTSAIRKWQGKTGPKFTKIPMGKKRCSTVRRVVQLLCAEVSWRCQEKHQSHSQADLLQLWHLYKQISSQTARLVLQA